MTDNAKAGDGTITDDQALSAIKSYCYASMPDLKSVEEERTEETLNVKDYLG